MKTLAEKIIHDSVIGLDQKIIVWGLQINCKIERIYVNYDVQTLSPTGVIVATLENQSFERYNKPADGDTAADSKFNGLYDSQVGQAIKGMIQNDLEKYPNLNQ